MFIVLIQFAIENIANVNKLLFFRDKTIMHYIKTLVNTEFC